MTWVYVNCIGMGTIQFIWRVLIETRERERERENPLHIKMWAEPERNRTSRNLLLTNSKGPLISKSPMTRALAGRLEKQYTFYEPILKVPLMVFTIWKLFNGLNTDRIIVPDWILGLGTFSDASFKLTIGQEAMCDVSYVYHDAEKISIWKLREKFMYIVNLSFVLWWKSYYHRLPLWIISDMRDGEKSRRNIEIEQ